VSYRPLPDEEPLAVYHEARDRLLERVPNDWGSERGAHLEVSEPLLAPGLLTPQGTALEEALRAELGVGPLGGAPFCTDGGRFEVAGIQSLICGPGDLDQAHQPNESISLAAFAEGTEHILRVTRRLCIGP
jgi:acetylornithine deacetylase